MCLERFKQKSKHSTQDIPMDFMLDIFGESYVMVMVNSHWLNFSNVGNENDEFEYIPICNIREWTYNVDPEELMYDANQAVV